MYALLPDLDAVLITWLVEHPALAPLHQGRVGLDLAAGSGPAVRVASLGGVQDHPWQGESEYQVELWGGTDADANLLARTAVAAVDDFRGPVVDGFVIGSWVTLRPLDSPDPDTNRPRKIIQIALSAQPERE